MTVSLQVSKRDEDGKQLSALREEGMVPAVVYGPKQAPLPIAVSAKVFDKLRREAGESTIIELNGLGAPTEVLIKDVEFDPVKQVITHVDLYAIERGKDMTVDVPLHFIGEAPVEQTNLGSVTKVLHEVEVTCRPSKLPSHIDVDVSVLEQVEDKILIKDLVVADGVVIEAEPEDPVVVVSAAKSTSSEEDESSAPVDMDAIEVEQKGKDDATEESE